jgi:AcrR family transcriptional regulator
MPETADVSTRTPRRRPARRGEGDRLREEIVDAAGRLLTDSGDPSTLSLRAVAREVGVATTSIYLHFEDLSALVRAVKTRWLDQLADEVTSVAAAASGDPIEGVRAVAVAYVKAGMSVPNRYRVLFTSEIIGPIATPYLGVAAFEAAHEQVRRAVPESVDSYLVTVQFWCTMHGLVTLRQARPTFPWPDLDYQIDDLVDRLIGSTP